MYSKFFVVAGMGVLGVAGVALTAQERPEITGVSHLAVYTSNATTTDHYYRQVLGAAKQTDPKIRRA